MTDKLRMASEVFSGTGEVFPIFTETNKLAIMGNMSSDMNRGGCIGLASVHVMVEDLVPLPEIVAEPNEKLLLDLSWQSGRAGSRATIDITQGAMFTVGASATFNAFAYFVPATTVPVTFVPAALIVRAARRVAINVHWLGSVNPVKAVMTGPSLTLAAGVPSPFFRIPAAAHGMIAQGDTPAAFAGLTAEFATGPTAGSIRKSVLNPVANGATIDQGVQFYRFTALAPVTVYGSFDLWI